MNGIGIFHSKEHGHLDIKGSAKKDKAEPCDFSKVVRSPTWVAAYSKLPKVKRCRSKRRRTFSDRHRVFHPQTRPMNMAKWHRISGMTAP